MKLTRFKRPTRTATVAIASAAAGIALGVPGLALATHTGQDVPAPPANPTRASQIQNIDQVKTAIKGYYGDTLTSVTDPVPDSFGLLVPERQRDHAAAPVQPGRRVRPRDRGHRCARRPLPRAPGAQEAPRRQGDPVRHRRHDAEHLQLRDLQQLRLQPDDQRLLRERRLGRRLPGRARHGRPGERRGRQGLHGVLPDRSSGDPAAPARWRTCTTPATTSTTATSS